MEKLEIRYIDNKSYFLDWIYSHFPLNYNCLVDVFSTDAQIVLSVKKRKIIKILNDRKDLVINFFKVLRDKPKELKDRLYYLLFNQKNFNQYFKILETNNLINDDVEKAVLFFYFTQTKFFNNFKEFSHLAIENQILKCKKLIDEKLFQMVEKLREIVIENLDFRNLIKKYDSENTFFYCALPYYSFTKEDLDDFIKLSHKVKGKIMINYKNDKYVLNAFKDWHIIKKEDNVLIMNYGKNVHII